MEYMIQSGGFSLIFDDGPDGTPVLFIGTEKLAGCRVYVDGEQVHASTPWTPAHAAEWRIKTRSDVRAAPGQYYRFDGHDYWTVPKLVGGGVELDPDKARFDKAVPNWIPIDPDLLTTAEFKEITDLFQKRSEGARK